MSDAATTVEVVEQQDGTVQEQNVGLMREIALDLIRHLRNMPHVEGEPRRTLDELACQLRSAEGPDDLRSIYHKLNDVCDDLGALTDTFMEKALRERHNDLRKIIATITASMKSLSSSNETLGSKIDHEVGNIEQALNETDPKAASEKLLSVSQSLRQATSEVKAEVDSARERVRDASGRIKQLEEQLEQTRQDSLRDGLTRLYNRRAFDEMLEKTFAGKGVAGPCSLIMVDIDHFKGVNDTHGHLIGDALLMKVARILDGAVDANSFAARYGGEEFAVIVANATLTKARTLAEEIRARVSAGKWSYRRDGEARTLTATISLGVAEFRAKDTAPSIVERADRALYLAKQSGRNQVRTELELARAGE